MNNQVVMPRFVKWAFVLALLAFAVGMLNLRFVLYFVGVDNNFLASNGRIPPIFFVTIIFGLGWWFENFIENLAISKGWQVLTIYMLGSLLTIIALALNIMLTADSFLHSIILTSGYVLVCGYHLRFSSLRTETIARLQVRN